LQQLLATIAPTPRHFNARQRDAAMNGSPVAYLASRIQVRFSACVSSGH
jgi:hypothetical protein